MMIDPIELLTFGAYGITTIVSWTFVLVRRWQAFWSSTDRRHDRKQVLGAVALWITSLMFGGFLLLSVALDVPNDGRVLFYMGLGSFGAAGVLEALYVRKPR